MSRTVHRHLHHIHPDVESVSYEKVVVEIEIDELVVSIGSGDILVL